MQRKKYMKDIKPLIFAISLFGGCIALALIFLPIQISYHPSPSSNFAALLVSSNLVYRPCPCGFCKPSEGIAVPEHIGVIGYDLVWSVSTNLLPIVSLPSSN